MGDETCHHAEEVCETNPSKSDLLEYIMSPPLTAVMHMAWYVNYVPYAE